VTPPRRVLHVIDSLPPGGAEHVVLATATHLPADRFQSSVCTLHAIDEASPIVRALRVAGIPVVGLGDHRRRHDPRHVADVARVIRREHIDIVHAHLPYAVSTSVAACRAARAPLLATVHSVREYRRGRSRFSDSAKTRLLRYGPQVVITCSASVRDEVIGPLGVPKQKCLLLPNAIDIDAIRAGADGAAAVRAALLGTAPGPLILAVGSLLPAKGHQHLVDAFATIRRRHPEAVLAIAGRPGANEAVVRAHIQSHRLQASVQLLGHRTDTAALLAASDVFALCSEWEGLPLSLLEAMACGTPVVATRVGGVPDVIKDGLTGLLVPPHDVPALADAISVVLEDRDLAEALAVAALAHVRQDHDIASWVTRLVAIYDETAPARGGP